MKDRNIGRPAPGQLLCQEFWSEIVFCTDCQFSVSSTGRLGQGQTLTYSRLHSHPDRLGRAFSPVKSDVAGNIRKLQRALANNPARTMQDLIRSEKAAGNHMNKDGACCALLWLKRCARSTASCCRHVQECYANLCVVTDCRS